MSGRISNTFETQDWIIVIEALASWSGSPKRVETPREERAWELIETIAATQGLEASELLRQVDQEWDGPEG